MHLSKIALKGAVDSIWLAAQNCGCVILGHCQRVAAVHPVVLRTVRVNPATGSWRPSRTLLHIYTCIIKLLSNKPAFEHLKHPGSCLRMSIWMFQDHQDASVTGDQHQTRALSDICICAVDLIVVLSICSLQMKGVVASAL